MSKLTITSRLLVSLTLLIPTLLLAQSNELTMRGVPWDLFAETTQFDGKQNMAIFTGLRIAQGRISIEADEGRATNADQAKAKWHFSGNVQIMVNNGRIDCDAADLEFADFSLKSAAVTGSPATFRLQREGSDDSTYAEAGKLLYDVENGVIEFSDNAKITEGGKQIESNLVVYNIAAQTIVADSTGQDRDRVRIIYNPDENGTTNSDTVDEDSDDDAANPNSNEPPNP